MNYNFLGGIGLILLGGIIIFLKIKKKWTYKFDEDTASNKILTYKSSLLQSSKLSIVKYTYMYFGLLITEI